MKLPPLPSVGRYWSMSNMIKTRRRAYLHLFICLCLCFIMSFVHFLPPHMPASSLIFPKCKFLVVFGWAQEFYHWQKRLYSEKIARGGSTSSLGTATLPLTSLGQKERNRTMVLPASCLLAHPRYPDTPGDCEPPAIAKSMMTTRDDNEDLQRRPKTSS